MGLDIRLPLGVMFTVIGGLLAGFGLVSNPAIYGRSLGININLWWGLVLGVFGLGMLLMAWRKAAARTRSEPGPAPTSGPVHGTGQARSSGHAHGSGQA